MKDKKTIEETIKSLNKKYDENAVMKIGEMKRANVESFSTGCYGLDEVFGCKGVPKGRIVELYGSPSSGKSSLALFLIAQIQKQGGKAMFIDAEMSWTRDYSEKMGVNIDDLLLSQPETGEEALNIVDEMASTGDLDLVVVDSVASLVPKAELEGGIEKNSIALQARMLSKALRILTGNLAKSQTTLIMINQIRQRTGIFFGSPNITPGGKALKFFSSIRLEVKGKKIKDKKDEIVGSQLSITAVKNKIGIPFKTTELDLYFGKGIDLMNDLLEFGLRKEIIEKVGNTYSFHTLKLGVGRDQSKEFLKKNPEVVDKIKKELDKKLKQ